MATEQYSNLASTSLTAAYTAGDGTATVANTGNAFPANPNFRIGIYDALTGVEKVLLKVTSVISATKFAVTAEGTDANGANGDTVVQVLTKGAIDTIRTDLIQAGVDGSLPGTASQSAGNLYFDTDSPIIYRFDGAAWKAFNYGVIASTFIDTVETNATTTYADLATPESLVFVLKATTNVIVQYSSTASFSAANAGAFSMINMDGVLGTASVHNNVTLMGSAADVAPAVFTYKTSLTSGTHTAKIQHKVSTGTSTYQSRLFVISVSP